MLKLREAVNLAASATPRTTTMAVLTHLAIKSDGQTVLATGTNLEIGLQVRADFQAEPFECCVDAEKFKQALASMPEPTLKFSDNKLLIKQGKTRATIPTIPYQDHPGIATLPESATTITADIYPLIETVAHAVASQDVRFFLTGVLLQSNGKEIVAVATDGHRMSVARLAYEAPKFDAIIPGKSIKTLLATRPKVIAIGKCIVCSQENVTVTSKLIDGRFPDWRRVLPHHTKQIHVERADIIRALQAVKPFSHIKFGGAQITWSETGMKIQARNEEQAEAAVEIECGADTAGEVGVNIAYLEEALKACTSENVAIHYSDPNAAIRIDDGNNSFVVMPMRF